jgi:CzcA family heavy metal efflux pump
MKRLIEASIEHRWLVMACSILLLVAGGWSARDMPIDVFPDLTAPTVTVLTEGQGMSPGEMEALVTFPIETTVNGASGVRRVRSATALGISVAWVEFDWGTDIYIARQIVSEKLSLIAGSLPPQAGRPVLAPISSIMGEILFFAVESDSRTPMELRTIADTTIRRRLLAAPGVSQVTPIGGEEKQYQVVADPDRLRANGVSIDQLIAAVERASTNTSPGVFVEGPQEYVLEAIGRVRSADDIGTSVVARHGDRPVLVRDVADVREGAALKRGEGARNGRPAVIIGVQKQPGANTIELTKRLDSDLDDLQREIGNVTIDRRIFRQSDFIETAIHNVVQALRDGGLLVVLVVVLFLANTRAAAITLMAIPLSLAGAILVLRGMGATLNTMTLGGLAIAIGALVDDAIIDVENVVRRLRENQLRPPEERRPSLAIVRDATVEIQSSIVFATLIIILVFLPVFGLSGVEGRLLAPLGFAYIVALAVSLGVAIIVTPALCAVFLPSAASVVRGHEGWLAAHLKAAYARRLPSVLDRPRTVMGVSAFMLAAAVAGLFLMGSAFLPEFHEGTLTLSVNTMPGTSLAKSNEIGQRIEQILLAQPEVVATARRQGRAEYDEHVQGVEGAEIDVGLRETDRPRPALLAELRRQFSTIAGTNVVIGQPISHRIDHMLSGTRANIAIKIFGDDLGTLRRLAEHVQNVIGGISGVADLSVEHQVDVGTIRFVLDRTAMARYGLVVEDVTRTIETAFSGTKVGRVFESGVSFDLVVKLSDAASGDFERIAALPIDTPDGTTVPVSSVARVVREESPNMVLRENVQRRIVVSCNVAGRDLGGVIGDIKREIGAQVSFPAGYRVEYGGQFDSQQAASRSLMLLGGFALAGLFSLLMLAFGRARDAFIIMVNLPLALIGGVAGVYVAGGTLSVASIIGFITLFGIATRNGIMLVSHVRHLGEDYGVTDFRAAIVQGSQERLIPILMTALAAGLALIPLAFSGGRAGSEIQTPMAIVILCGLATSTFLNMAVVPTLYLRYGKPKPPSRPTGG